MNIKSRLSKIEDKLNINFNFCHCERDLVIKVKAFDEVTEDLQKICEDCGKLIDSFNFTFNINAPFETNVILPSLIPGEEL